MSTNNASFALSSTRLGVRRMYERLAAGDMASTSHLCWYGGSGRVMWLKRMYDGLSSGFIPWR